MESQMVKIIKKLQADNNQEWWANQP